MHSNEPEFDSSHGYCRSTSDNGGYENRLTRADTAVDRCDRYAPSKLVPEPAKCTFEPLPDWHSAACTGLETGVVGLPLALGQ